MFTVIRKVWPNARGETIGSFPDEESAQALIESQIESDTAHLRALFGDSVTGPIKAPAVSKDTKSLYGYEVYVRIGDKLAAAVEVWGNAPREPLQR